MGWRTFIWMIPKPTCRPCGNWPARERRADGIVCSFPTVTWPNHTTLVTGTTPAKHGVIGNNYLDRKSATQVPFIPDPLFDKDQIVKVPTIYDAAHDAGLVTAGIVWPATRNARTLDWTVPDMFGKEALVQIRHSDLAGRTAAGGVAGGPARNLDRRERRRRPAGLALHPHGPASFPKPPAELVADSPGRSRSRPTQARPAKSRSVLVGQLCG